MRAGDLAGAAVRGDHRIGAERAGLDGDPVPRLDADARTGLVFVPDLAIVEGHDQFTVRFHRDLGDMRLELLYFHEFRRLLGLFLLQVAAQAEFFLFRQRYGDHGRGRTPWRTCPWG